MIVVRPRIDRATARQLDRLARRAHAFHRFAHHPLCGAYSDEVIRIGKRRRVCRGCAAAALGLLVGALLGVTFGQLVRSSGVFATAVALLVASTLAAAASFVSARLRRSKWCSRALPGVGFGAATALGIELASGWVRAAFAVGCSMFALALVTAYRRRGPSRQTCVTCPERGRAVCSGLMPIVRRERAFQRRAQTLIDRAFRETPTA